MRTSRSLAHLAVCLSAFASVTSAWPGWMPEIDALVARADDSTTDTANTSDMTITAPPSTGTDATGTAEGTKTDDSGEPISTDLNTAGMTKTGTQTGTKTGTAEATKTGGGGHKNSSHTSFPYDSPAGGVSMQTPATILTPTPLYMIGDNVTLGWNYTSLLGTPTAIDVLISCTANQATWTLTSNMTFETDVSYVWNSGDTNADVSNPLLTEMYTMIIKDSDADVTDIPDPGYLGAYKNFFFGMYKRLDYVPYDEWTCPGGCSAAAPSVERHALGFIVSMGLITVLSFTWFVSGLNLH